MTTIRPPTNAGVITATFYSRQDIIHNGDEQTMNPTNPDHKAE